MKWKISKPQIPIYLCSAIILFVGMASSIFIYLTTENVSDNVLGYEVEKSKKYLHDLELYGGKTNALAVEFMKWLNGLWHGKSLAYTIGCITILIFSVLFFVAYLSASDLGSNDRDENKRG